MQFLSCGAALAGGFSLVLGGRIPRPQTVFAGFCWLAVWGTLLGSLLTFSVNEVPLGHYVRTIMPWLLFGVGYWVGIQRGGFMEVWEVLRVMKLGCVVSVFHKVLVGFYVTSLGVDEIRYQIISPVLFCLEAILFYEILVERPKGRLPIFLLMVCFSIQLISVTRSAFVGVFLILGVALWMGSGSSKRFLPKVFKVGFLLLGLMVGAVAVSLYVSPMLLDRWVQRIFHFEATGVDLTTVTRLAEISEQLNLWKSDAFSIWFGQGFGASYAWSEEYMDILRVAFSIDEVATPQFYAGHNFFVHSLFAGGLLFGPLVPLATLWACWIGVRATRQALSDVAEWGGGGGSGPELLARTLGQSTLMTVALFAATIGGNPLGWRYSGLMHGLALGLLVASVSQAGLLGSRRVRRGRIRQEVLLGAPAR